MFAANLSRRRLLAGAAWATPAVLIATAAPAAAASGAPGALALFQTSATSTATSLYARAYVTYAGAGAPSPDAPVSDITVEISVPTNRRVNGVPSVAGAGWAWTTTATVLTNTVYTFEWTGSDLSSAFPSTTQLVAVIPKAASMNTLAVNFTGRGTSNSTAVTPATANATALNAGVLAFALGAASRVNYIAAFNSGSGTFPAYRLRPTVRNSGVAVGANRPAAQPITGIAATVSIPEANTTGVRYDRVPPAVGAGWTLTSGPSLASGVWTLVYSYAGAPVPPNATRDSTPLDFMMRAIAPRADGSVTVTIAGTSAGLQLSATHQGPLA